MIALAHGAKRGDQMKLDATACRRAGSQVGESLVGGLRRSAQVARAGQLPSGCDGCCGKDGRMLHADIVLIWVYEVRGMAKKIANFDRFRPGGCSSCDRSA